MSRVAVVGASPDAERYSNKAMKLLKEKGHAAVPVAPKHERICDEEVFPSLRDVPGEAGCGGRRHRQRRSAPCDLQPRR